MTKKAMMRLSVTLIVLLFISISSPVFRPAWPSADAYAQEPVTGGEIGPAETPQPTEEPQPTATPRPTAAASQVRDVSFREFYYEETILRGPYDSTYVYFNLPPDWLVQEGSEVRLHVLYTSENLGQVVGEPYTMVLNIILDGELLKSMTITSAREEDIIVVPLPPKVVNTEILYHEMQIALELGTTCQKGKSFSMSVKEDSSYHFVYSISPIEPDLVNFPSPIYNGSFEPSGAYFILPDKATSSDLLSAVSIAARLGDASRESISLTTTVASMVTEEMLSKDHLVIVGTPQDNGAIIELGGRLRGLPLFLGKRSMEIYSQAPEAVVPLEPFTMTVTISNTTGYAVSGIQLVAALPNSSELIHCGVGEAGCKLVGRELLWDKMDMGPGGEISMTFAISATSVASMTMGSTFTLLDKTGLPLNALTWSVPVTSSWAAADRNDVVRFEQAESPYFFVQNGRAVAETDGIIIEGVSLWNPRKVVLVVTGVDRDAVSKAARALQMGSTIPPLSGKVVLVEKVEPDPARKNPDFKTVRTFKEMGRADEQLVGNGTHVINYTFALPAGWQLDDLSHLQLDFSHSRTISYENSSINVKLNGTIIENIRLNDANASGGRFNVSLADRYVFNGDNDLQFVVDVVSPGECPPPNTNSAWVNIHNTSLLYLSHSYVSDQSLWLSDFPSSFNRDEGKVALSIILPEKPSVTDYGVAVLMGSTLGNAFGHEYFEPRLFYYGDEEMKNALPTDHLIMVGRPTTNKMAMEISTVLPLPFEEGSDRVSQSELNVIFRLPPDLSVGVLEMIPSPWASGMNVLLVSGTDDDAMTKAAALITGTGTRWHLDGDIAVVTGGKYYVVDSRYSPDKEPEPPIETGTETREALTPAATPAAATSAAAPTSTPTPEPQAGKEGGLLDNLGDYPLAMIALGVGVLLLIIFGVWRGSESWRVR